MSVATEHRLPAKPGSEARVILGPSGNRIRVSEEAKRKKESLKKNQKPSRLVWETPCLVAGNKLSVDSTCSSDSSSGGSSVKMVSSKRRMKPNGLRSVKVVPDGVESVVPFPIPVKRCDWITANSGE